MRLYEIKRESKIITDVGDGSSYVIFNTIDGMYSYCTTEKGGVVHLSAMTPLIKLDNGDYIIDYEQEERGIEANEI